MSFPPPTGPASPTPPLWAPRLRFHLNRFFAYMDRRRHRELSRQWQEYTDGQWRIQYHDWWIEHGWQQGADNPDVAFTKMRGRPPMNAEQEMRFHLGSAIDILLRYGLARDRDTEREPREVTISDSQAVAILYALDAIHADGNIR